MLLLATLILESFFIHCIGLQHRVLFEEAGAAAPFSFNWICLYPDPRIHCADEHRIQFKNKDSIISSLSSHTHPSSN